MSFELRGDLAAEVRRKSIPFSVAQISGENAHRIPAYLFILLFIYLFIKFVCRPSPIEHLWAAGNVARFHSAFQSLEKSFSQSLYLTFCCCWGDPVPRFSRAAQQLSRLCCLSPGLASPLDPEWKAGLCVICARWTFENSAAWGLKPCKTCRRFWNELTMVNSETEGQL